MIRAKPGLVLATLACLPLASPAATLTWPGDAGPCAGTLQACIDATAPGDTIEVRGALGPFPGDDLLLRAGRSLVAAPGPAPRFGAGADWTIESGGADDIEVRIEGLVLEDARIAYANFTGGGNALLRIAGNRFRGQSRGPIDLRHQSGGSFAVDVYGNLVDFSTAAAAAPSAINVLSENTSVDARIAFNQVRFPAKVRLGGDGIRWQNFGSSAGALVLLGNRIDGRGFRHGIRVEDLSSSGGSGLDLAIAHNAVRGQHVDAFGNGAGIEVRREGAGVTDARVINNTVVEGVRGVLLSRDASSGPLQGFLGNNLIARQLGFAFDFTSVAQGSAPGEVDNGHNLVFAVGGTELTGGTGNQVADPLLLDGLRPAPGSPAIDSGSDSILAELGSAFLGSDALDLDGQPRLQGAAVDRGAREGMVRSTRVATTAAAAAPFAFALTDDNPDARPIATQLGSSVVAGELAPEPTPFGTRYDGVTGEWRIALADNDPLPVGGLWSVLAPDAAHAFAHTEVTGIAPISALDDARVNGRDDILVLVTPRYSGTADARILVAPGVSYGAPTWVVTSAVGNIPAGADFHVYAQPRSPAAFLVPAEGDALVFGDATLIDHPLLEDAACARLQVTPRYTAGIGSAQGVPTWFAAADGGRWLVRDVATSTPPEGTWWQVWFDPAQVEACRAPLFSDDFESP